MVRPEYFKPYQPKPRSRYALEITADMDIREHDSHTRVFYPEVGDPVFFKHYEPVSVGDYIIWQRDNDVYHCARDVFLDRYIVSVENANATTTAANASKIQDPAASDFDSNARSVTLKIGEVLERFMTKPSLDPSIAIPCLTSSITFTSFMLEKDSPVRLSVTHCTYNHQFKGVLRVLPKVGKPQEIERWDLNLQSPDEEALRSELLRIWSTVKEVINEHIKEAQEQAQ